jgi:DNA sulfur modification protein DndD
MLLRKIALTNIGLFQGRHEFDLMPQFSKTASRPITLIGGMNGAGKTTMLESLRLCLYGKESLGQKVPQRVYDQHLAKLIHRTKDRKLFEPSASVELEFEHAHLGTTDVYRVNRSWNKNGNGIVENLSVARNDKPLDDLVSEQWQAFLKDLIPPGLSSLFFFDGEKIQNLADEVQGSVELASSIKSLLGLDLAERLSTDLNTYIRKKASGKSDPKLDSKLKAIRKELVSYEKQVAIVEQDQAQIRSRRDHILSKIEKAEAKLTAEGGEFAQSRAELQAEENTLNLRQEELENDIRLLCAENLPFALAPKLCSELLNQLSAEIDIILRKSIAKGLSSLNKTATKELKQLIQSAGIDTKSSQKVVTLVKEWLKDHTSEKTASKQPIIHELSERDTHSIEEILRDSITSLPDRVAKTAKALNATTERKAAVQSALSKMPSDEHIAPILKDLTELNQKLGMYIEQINSKENDHRALINKIADNQRVCDKLLGQKNLGSKSQTKVDLAKRAIKAMHSYKSQLTKRKIEQLNHAVLEKYSHLSRKDDAVKSISIDPDSFRVTLLDSQDHHLEMKELSAGEKQILAVSILWALASTSGRLLPVVIDTPLGRLDSSHRDNLIENYFPQASHQVIILSTDTEVDKSLYDKLAPHIANIYHLDYDKKAKRTESRSGYFWK